MKFKETKELVEIEIGMIKMKIDKTGIDLIKKKTENIASETNVISKPKYNWK